MKRKKTLTLVATFGAILVSARLIPRRDGPSLDANVDASMTLLAPVPSSLASADLAKGSSRARFAPPLSDSADLVAVTVRDVATSEAVVGLALAVEGPSTPAAAAGAPREGARIVTTDASGRIHVSPRARPPIPVDALRWRVVAKSPTEDLVEPVMWVVRTLRIHGRVHSDAPSTRAFDTRQVDVVVEGLGSPHARFDGPGGDGPETFGFLRAHGLDAVHGARVDPATGAFEIVASRLRWLGVRARAPGWVADLTDISDRVAQSSDDVEVDVVMRRAPTIGGRVLDEEGRPLSRARVRLQFTTRSTMKTFNPERFVVEGYAVTAAGTNDGRVVVNYAVDAVVGDDGAFHLDVPFESDATLLVHAHDRAPTRVDLGRPTVDERKDVSLGARAPRRVGLTDAGRPCPADSVLILDITDRERQLPLGFVEVDARGAMPSEWLETGREYMLMVKSSARTVYVVWRDQSAIDLNELPTSLDAFEVRRR